MRHHKELQLFFSREPYDVYNRQVKVWDHSISISTASGRTRYRDTVTIDAGLFTLPVWLFAQVFYRHRQRRWRSLAKRSFRC